MNHDEIQRAIDGIKTLPPKSALRLMVDVFGLWVADSKMNRTRTDEALMVMCRRCQITLIGSHRVYCFKCREIYSTALMFMLESASV